MLPTNPREQKKLDSHVYIARQAILDSEGNLFGYELLYRNSMDNRYPKGVSDTEATARMYAEHFLGECAVAFGKTRAFINFDYASLANGIALDFPPESIVVEVLETCAPTDELFTILQGLKSKGYIIALDDFIPSEDWAEFYPLIDIIKFDLQSISPFRCRMLVEQLKNYNIRFLAEKVESYEEYEKLKRYGCNLFQGYYFTKPQMIKKTRLSSSTEVLISLSKMITDRPLDHEAINSVIEKSPSLSYQLLRYVNHSGVVGKIVNVKQALAYLGDERITRYCSYALLSQLGENKPSALQLFALKRARLMQKLSRHLQCNEAAEQAYLTGLISLIDAMLDTSIASIKENLNLDPAIFDALIHQQGCIGKLLQLCKLLELNDWEAINDLSRELGITESEIIALAVDSELWAAEAFA